MRKLELRIAAAARTSMADRGFVTSIDVLMGIGWLQARYMLRLWPLHNQLPPSETGDIDFGTPRVYAIPMRTRIWDRRY